jgi:hypothetical protein
MSYTLPIFSQNATASTADTYHSFSNSVSSANTTTEANVEQQWYDSGTISYLTAYVSANSAGSTNTIYLRVNGANGNQSLTITAGATGEFIDSTNTDVYADGDTVSIFYDRTGSSTTINFVGAHVTPDSGAVMKLSAVGETTWANNNSTRFVPLSGEAGYSSAIGVTENATVEFPFDCAGTIENLNCYVSANARPNAVTVRVRRNNVDSSLVISIAAGTTGLFSDTTNSRSISVGDTANYSILLGSGGGNFTSQYISCDFKTTDGKTMAFASNVLVRAGVVNGVTRYGPIFGGIASTGGTTGYGIKMRCSGTVSKLRVYCSANTGNTNAVCTVRKNASNTSLVATVTASTTGEFADTSNSFTFSSGDELDIKYVRAAGSGTTTLMRIGMLMEVDNVSTFLQSIRYY